jgi:hypothetical protein
MFYFESAINHQVPETPVEGRAAIQSMSEASFAAADIACIV